MKQYQDCTCHRWDEPVVRVTKDDGSITIFTCVNCLCVKVVQKVRYDNYSVEGVVSPIKMHLQNEKLTALKG